MSRSPLNRQLNVQTGDLRPEMESYRSTKVQKMQEGEKHVSNKKASVFDRLPCLIKKSNVTIFPEGLLGYLLGPTLALLANSVLANYFNKYMTDVLNINNWASEFFKWLPVVSVIFVVVGNIIVGRLMDNKQTKAGKARPLLLV